MVARTPCKSFQIVACHSNIHFNWKIRNILMCWKQAHARLKLMKWALDVVFVNRDKMRLLLLLFILVDDCEMLWFTPNWTNIAIWFEWVCVWSWDMLLTATKWMPMCSLCTLMNHWINECMERVTVFYRNHNFRPHMYSIFKWLIGIAADNLVNLYITSRRTCVCVFRCGFVNFFSFNLTMRWWLKSISLMAGKLVCVWCVCISLNRSAGK